MDQLKIDKDGMKTCANGAEGNHLLHLAGMKTDSVPDRGGTPWMMMDGKHIEPEDLLKDVCAKVGPGPKVCEPFESKASSGSHDKEKEEDDDKFQVFGKVN